MRIYGEFAADSRKKRRIPRADRVVRPYNAHGIETALWGPTTLPAHWDAANPPKMGIGPYRVLCGFTPFLRRTQHPVIEKRSVRLHGAFSVL